MQNLAQDGVVCISASAGLLGTMVEFKSPWSSRPPLFVILSNAAKYSEFKRTWSSRPPLLVILSIAARYWRNVRCLAILVNVVQISTLLISDHTFTWFARPAKDIVVWKK
jgi:hypothetical protein